jgi:hypothetical protein
MADDDLRVSDAERDQAARLLRDHCAAGRLTIDELDARLETVYAAKTRKELGRTTIDPPPDERSSPPPQQGRRVSSLALPRSTRSDTYTARS